MSVIDTIVDYLSDFDHHNVRALLLPQSHSAIESLQQAMNKEKVANIPSFPFQQTLPFSSISDDEHTGSKPNTRQQKIAQQHEHRDRVSVVLLGQTQYMTRFTMGACSSSWVVLKHQTVEDGEDHDCYINLIHCQFIPDPDSDCLTMHNSSTTHFLARPNSGMTDKVISVAPHEEIALRGIWHLTLGKGLEFILFTLPHRRCKSPWRWEPIPDIPTVAKMTLARADVSPKNTNGKIDQTPQCKCAPHSGCLDLPLPTQILGQTSLTQVFKTFLHGKVVAAKVCRKPQLRWAADLWENERSILKHLNNHVCRIIRFDL